MYFIMSPSSCPGFPFWNSTTGNGELPKSGATVAGLYLGWLFNVGHLKSTADVMLDFRRDPSLLTTLLPGPLSAPTGDSPPKLSRPYLARRSVHRHTCGVTELNSETGYRRKSSHQA